MVSLGTAVLVTPDVLVLVLHPTLYSQAVFVWEQGFILVSCELMQGFQPRNLDVLCCVGWYRGCGWGGGGVLRCQSCQRTGESSLFMQVMTHFESFGDDADFSSSGRT